MAYPSTPLEDLFEKQTMENEKNNPPDQPCHVCGDIGNKDFMMNCFNCRQVREHIYCARVCLRAVPDMWLCQVCRSSTRVLQISNCVDKEETSMPVLHQRLDPPPRGLMLLAHSCPDDDINGKVDHPVTNDTSPSEQHRPQFLAFPSPKRKPRTIRGRSWNNTNLSENEIL